MTRPRAEATELTAVSPRRHRGDIMSVETRSAVMARIKGKNTGPELAVAGALSAKGHTFETHAKDLPGRPDISFRDAMVAVFVDGDFWHGWRFSTWRDKLSEAWEAKIAATRRRDDRNFRRLRRAGWKVIRVWEHQVVADLPSCIARIEAALGIKHEKKKKRGSNRASGPGQGPASRYRVGHGDSSS